MLDGIGWWPVEGMVAEEIRAEYRGMLQTMLSCHSARLVIEIFGYGRVTMFRDKEILGIPACERGGKRRELCVPYQNKIQTIKQIMGCTGRKYSAVYSEIRRAR